ncbi:hypothetical protein TRICHSKD4_4065 [Roseibium sp. TrichSKD4]|nr:hypothetical protein TRICHSKD4_4065 [Roseibium sp. TrichSKD4]
MPPMLAFRSAYSLWEKSDTRLRRSKVVIGIYSKLFTGDRCNSRLPTLV